MYRTFCIFAETETERNREEVPGMLKTRTKWFCLGLLNVSLMLAACGPSAEELQARDDARAAALAAEALADNLEAELANLPGDIAAAQEEIVMLEAELAELQEEYYALGGGSR
jgi:Skp family chaperone for outer membrane proteins